ncbi:MAG TPA: helix-turn-helix domain-containing protein [Gemmataceae bacterium]|nr:helix-turn-helix domain-containing protein [Gemmataceae bacterium]
MPNTITAIHPTGIYNTDDLCAMLDVSPQTLAEARRDGTLRATRKGRRVIYLGEWVLNRDSIETRSFHFGLSPLP